jgi:hypothetical protein
MTRLYSTVEAAVRANASLERFRSAIARGAVTKPAFRVGPSFLWTEAEIRRATAEFARVRQNRPRQSTPPELAHGA